MPSPEPGGVRNGPGFSYSQFSARDILLVATGPGLHRRSVIGLEYRYQTEVVAAVAVALALACMPLLGATESAEADPSSTLSSTRVPSGLGRWRWSSRVSLLTSVRFMAPDLRDAEP